MQPLSTIKRQSVAKNSEKNYENQRNVKRIVDASCSSIVVLPKTEHTPEYRTMRQVDNGYINATALLTAGGIKT